MNAQRINITLPPDVAWDFKRMVPSGKRSKYIAQIIEEFLRQKGSTKKALIKSLKANRKFDEQIMKEWEYVDAEAFKKLP